MIGVLDRSNSEVLAQRSALRAQKMAIQLCQFSLPLFLLAIVASMMWDVPWIAMGDLFALLGGITTIALNKYFRGQKDMILWPAYIGFWISTFPITLITGGITGPFCLICLTLLFLVGVLIQTRLPMRHVFLFTLSNLLFWFLFERLKTPVWDVFFLSQNLPDGFLWTRSSFYLVGLFSCVVAVIKTQQIFDQDAASKELALNETQSHLTHTVKLAEAGDLLATTAHELAQPVQVISISTSLLANLLKECSSSNHSSHSTSIDTQARLVEKISEASRRLNRLLTQLRSFSRKEPFQCQTFDLREAVSATQLLTEHDLKSRNIQFEFHVGNHPFWIEGDILRIQQVLLNLINNARDAALGDPSPFIQVLIEEHHGFARIYVMNNGPQIPVHVQNKLFQPYFTTKARGQGTGIGLTISAEIVEQHRGHLRFFSEEGKTVFWFDLPITTCNVIHSKEKSSA